MHFRTDGSVGAKGFKISFEELNQGAVQRSKNGIELNSPCNNFKLEEGVCGWESFSQTVGFPTDLPIIVFFSYSFRKFIGHLFMIHQKSQSVLQIKQKSSIGTRDKF